MRPQLPNDNKFLSFLCCFLSLIHWSLSKASYIISWGVFENRTTGGWINVMGWLICLFLLYFTMRWDWVLFWNDDATTQFYHKNFICNSSYRERFALSCPVTRLQFAILSLNINNNFYVIDYPLLRTTLVIIHEAGSSIDNWTRIPIQLKSIIRYQYAIMQVLTMAS